MGIIVERVFREVNDLLCSMLGYTRAELLGHSDVATTLRFYVKSSEDKLRQGVAILSDVVFQTQPAKKRASL